MQLKSLKISKAEAKEKSEAMCKGPGDGSRYPYGTCINLDKDALEKLGINVRDFKAKDGIRVEAVGFVKSIRSSEGDTYESSSLELQLTSLGVEKKAKTAVDAVSRGVKEANED